MDIPLDPAGGIPPFPLEQWYLDTPPLTRTWLTLAIALSLLTQAKLLNPLQLYYSLRTVFFRSQYWRLLTTFLYFGPLGLDMLYHLFFLQRYSRLLEASMGSTGARFAWLMAFATTTLLLLSSSVFGAGEVPFLGSALTSTLVYIWSRRNPEVRLSLMGLMVFSAPWLPWVLMGFNVVMHGSVPRDEILGVVVGHTWYFLADVWPGLYVGQRPMEPPGWWVRLWEGRDTGSGSGRGREVGGDVAVQARGLGGEVREVL